MYEQSQSEFGYLPTLARSLAVGHTSWLPGARSSGAFVAPWTHAAQLVAFGSPTGIAQFVYVLLHRMCSVSISTIPPDAGPSQTTAPSPISPQPTSP